MSGMCNGRVVIITGAGGGLGRAYALGLAAEGAKIVVNDINAEAAQSVVDAIVEAGGEAIVNQCDITNYEESKSAVTAAIEAFGDLHVVINNAGMCRDRMFASLTEADWDGVIGVHLKGHFCISSHAVHHWRAQKKAGNEVNARLINTSSGAGLHGSLGQSNYVAAKAGIAALTLNQAVELDRYGVTANGLAPCGRTGMTEEIFADMMKKPEDGGFDYYDPANVAPFIVWLASEQSKHVTGQLFGVEGGKIIIHDGWKDGPTEDRKARWDVADIGPAVDALIAQAQPPFPVHGAE